jgi:hypothetical protein
MSRISVKVYRAVIFAFLSLVGGGWCVVLVDSAHRQLQRAQLGNHSRQASMRSVQRGFRCANQFRNASRRTTPNLTHSSFD